MSKQLGDFLKEQQEPFALEVYLLERGYLRNSFNSEHNFPLYSSKSSTKMFNRSASCALHKKRKFIPNCSKIVRTFLSRLVPVNNDHKIKNSASGDQNGCIRDMEKSIQEVADDDKFSSTSSTIVAHYSSVKGDILSIADSSQALNDGNLLSIKEVAADRKRTRKNVEESYQLSPVSVLEETESDDGSSILKTRKYLKRIQEASSLSVPSCNLEKQLNSSAREMQELNGSKFLALYAKNKKAVLQTKQLLLDCVREVIENQRRTNSRGQQFQKILGAEELRKLIYENIWLWSKETIDESNIEDLLHFDLLASMEEWSNFEQQTSEIGIEIGDAIFEDIRNQIIADMINIVS